MVGIFLGSIAELPLCLGLKHRSSLLSSSRALAVSSPRPLRSSIFTSRVRDACFQKCIHRFAESEVSLGEGSCVDRCVVKYMKVFEKVGTRISPGMGGAPGGLPH